MSCYKLHSVKDEQPKEKKLKKKELSSEKITSQKESQSKKKESQCSLTSFKDTKSNSFIANDFTESKKSRKTQGNKFQEGDKFSMQDDYTKKKPRKV